MAKRINSLPYDRRGGVVAIQRRLITADAYLGLSPQGKDLLHLMHVYWRPFEPAGYGVREAEHSIPCCRRIAMRAFRELQDSGFIVMIEESLFCSRAKSKTRTWRLTWMPWNYSDPTNEWEAKRALPTISTGAYMIPVEAVFTIHRCLYAPLLLYHPLNPSVPVIKGHTATARACRPISSRG